ncbi:AraC-like DNA-binding protein [Stackebrandtia albiflava]|uniref:AraC-like DNA-binding protein n=1 Tax=Stackebrandtia albiflava TaxID=406432 RepID=A0A562V2J9_9ACTN|nr:AraC family transcriptional regulator [Stackebrandtia albiflava]TWJ12075.1 AraC-like DNA-binding protein [Stackebrandtia albiflava]
MTTATLLPPDPVPLHRLCVPRPDTVPVAVGDFDSIGPESRAEYPHRHTFYEVVLVTGGRGEHVIDFDRHRLGPPHLGLITPGQVHYWRDVTGLRGRVLLFSEAFFIARPADRRIWRRLAHRPWLALTTAQAGQLDSLLGQMEAEHRAAGSDFVSVMQAFLHVLLVRATRVAGAASGGRENDGSVAQRFSRLLADGDGPPESVREYADRLGVSAGHLCEAVKTVTGRTPGQLIRESRILQARRLLGGTDLTVGQVSRRLGFADPAYFCRFFRRETGMTPTGFRRVVG